MSFTFVQSQLLLGAIGANFAHGTLACVLDAVQWPLKIMAQQKSSAIFGEMLHMIAVGWLVLHTFRVSKPTYGNECLLPLRMEYQNIYAHHVRSKAENTRKSRIIRAFFVILICF